MNVDVQALQSNLCTAFCREVTVRDRGDSISISLPMSARDGDRLTAYIQPSAGGWRVSDQGSTLMRLSYEHDLTKLLSGPRGKMFESILAESGLSEDNGDIFLQVPADALPRGLFTLGQGLTRVESLGLWSTSRVESTFYDDLRRALLQTVPESEIQADYVVPGVDSADSYPIDFRISTPSRPLFVFGVPNLSKARLTTIILQYIEKHVAEFDSMVVCSEIDELPKADRRRLMNAANDVVATISDVATIGQKIKHRRAA